MKPSLPLRLMLVVGTRPEAVKLAPVQLAAAARPEAFAPTLVSTGQHRELLSEALAAFGLAPERDLAIMTERQTLAEVASRSILGLDSLVRELGPDMVLVQGDTLAVAAGAMAAFFHQVPVGHVEAGLRTGDRYDPFPEEMSRRLAGQLATCHFAPTAHARTNLLREGVPDDRVYVTGNTVTDAVRLVADAGDAASMALAPVDGGAPIALGERLPGRRMILVTAHRRESIPDGIAGTCEALARLAARGDVLVVFSVHPNPAVREVVVPRLRGVEGVLLVEPPAYAEFAPLMRAATLVVTDSGGLQEEAPALGKPVLVTRDTTERPEAVEAGVAELVGTDAQRIYEAAARLLDDPAVYASRAHRANPFGDGRCSARILDAVLHHFGLGERPADLATV